VHISKKKVEVREAKALIFIILPLKSKKVRGGAQEYRSSKRKMGLTAA